MLSTAIDSLYSSIYTSDAKTTPLSWEDYKNLNPTTKTNDQNEIYELDFDQNKYSSLKNIDTKLRLMDLIKKLDSFLIPEQSPFNQIQVKSSNPGAITGVATPEAEVLQGTVQINSLASHQEIASHTFFTHKATNIEADDYTIQIEHQDKKYLFEISIESEEPNGAILKWMRDIVDTLDTGVKSYLESDPIVGLSRIRLYSEKAGAEESFSIKDIKGNLIEQLGLNLTTPATGQQGGVVATASSTILNFNNELLHSNETTVKVNDFLFLNVNKITSEDIYIDISPNLRDFQQGIEEFIDKFNETKEHFLSLGTEDSQIIARELENNLSKNQKELTNLGISFNKNGELEANISLLSKQLAADHKSAKSLLIGENGILEHVKARLETMLTQQDSITLENKDTDLHKKIETDQQVVLDLRENTYNTLGHFLTRNHYLFSSLS